jgi:hypothetical protein
MYNIVRLERYAQSQLRRKHHAAVVLFDMKAAFDSVWHDGLIYKLNDIRLPPYILNYLISFLNNRLLHVNLKIHYLVFSI